MELHIKNIVCGRCIKPVITIFEQTDFVPESVELSLVRLKETPDSKQGKIFKSGKLNLRYRVEELELSKQFCN